MSDRRFFLAGLVFTVFHAQVVMPALAPLGLLLSVFIASTSSAARASRNLLGPAMVAAVALQGILVARANGLQEGLSLFFYIREKAPFVYVAVIVLLFGLLRPTKESARSFCLGFATAAGLVAAFSIVLSLGGEYWMGVRLSRRGRLQGPLSGPNSLAGVLAPAMFCTVALWRERLTTWTLVRLPVLGFATLGLLMTSSRGYLLGTVAAGIVMAGILSPRQWSGRAGRTLAATMLLFSLAGASYMAASERISSTTADRNVESRFDFWKRGGDLWTDSPLVGYGFGVFEQHELILDTSVPLLASRTSGSYRDELVQFESDGGQHTHNFFIQMGVDVGLFGLALYLLFLFRGVRGSDLARSLLALGAVAGLFGGYALASPSGSAPLIMLCLAGFASTRSTTEPAPPDDAASSPFAATGTGRRAPMLGR